MDLAQLNVWILDDFFFSIKANQAWKKIVSVADFAGYEKHRVLTMP